MDGPIHLQSPTEDLDVTNQGSKTVAQISQEPAQIADLASPQTLSMCTT